MVKNCLLGSGELVDVDYPLDFYDEQGARAYNGVLGWLESLQNRPDILEQGRCDGRVLGLDKATIGDM